jgi:RNA recognition motif-containing protein
MKLFVGNLPFKITEDELRQIFSAHGEVQSVRIITDRESGRSRGFGFVEMDDEGGKTAMEQSNGMSVGGRELRVNEAQEKPRTSPSSRW